MNSGKKNKSRRFATIICRFGPYRLTNLYLINKVKYMANGKHGMQHYQETLSDIINIKKVNSVTQKLEALNRITEIVLSEFKSIKSNKTAVPGNDLLDFYDEVKRFEIELILFALKRNQGNQRAAAKMLRLNVTTINSKIKRYGLQAEYQDLQHDQSL
jgi:DNA-binding protein Fis